MHLPKLFMILWIEVLNEQLCCWIIDLQKSARSIYRGIMTKPHPWSSNCCIQESASRHQGQPRIGWKTMAGIQKVELPEILTKPKRSNWLSWIRLSICNWPDAKPLFHSRPFATIGNAVSLNHMFADTVNRETLYGKYIFNTTQSMAEKWIWSTTVKKICIEGETS